MFDPVATYARSTPGNRALTDLESGRGWTYAELDSAINRMGEWLVREFGPASGVRIATLSKNCAEMLILQFACIRAGCIFVPLNWRLAASEIKALAEDANPDILFCGTEFEPPSGDVRSMPIDDALSLGQSGTSPPKDARRPFDEVSTLLYTSGTSGRPKGVMLSEKNAFWGCVNFSLGNDVSMHSVFLCDMPLFHTAGLFAASRVPIQAGARVLISSGFDAPRTLARLTDSELHVSHYFSVPQMAAWIWNEPEFDAEKLGRLKCWAIGGAPHPKANAVKFIDAGIRIADGFGMTEIGSGFGMPPFDFEMLAKKTGSCGPAFASIESRIVDSQGDELPAGDVGELWLRGPSITSGYWNQPEATENSFTDGWFMTGDAGYIDGDGYLFLVDRQKDMFISGGENVYPAEVEAAIAELPNIAENAVVGVPDDQWGEVGRAYVVPAPGHTVSDADIINHCQKRLAKFKAPKTIVVTDSLPRTASGKLQKHVLRKLADEEMSGG